MSLPVTPFAKALLAYHKGDRDAVFTLSRDDGFSRIIPVATFFDDVYFTELEQHALTLCRGDVLDVGAAAGRHALALQRQGIKVTALEIEPVCEQILTERGVSSVVTANILNWSGRRFDTILMLMNGIGLVGCPESLDSFLGNLPGLLNAGGSVLCTSRDVERMDDPIHVSYFKSNVQAGRYFGEQLLSVSFAGETGQPFRWLHISPEHLAERCVKAGLAFSMIHETIDGHYLCRIRRQRQISAPTQLNNQSATFAK